MAARKYPPTPDSVVCAGCGREFKPRRDQWTKFIRGERKKGLFCQTKCHDDWRRRDGEARQKAHENDPVWLADKRRRALEAQARFREKHRDARREQANERMRKWRAKKAMIRLNAPPETGECVVCSTTFVKKNKNQLVCSPVCAAIRKDQVDTARRRAEEEKHRKSQSKKGSWKWLTQSIGEEHKGVRTILHTLEEQTDAGVFPWPDVLDGTLPKVHAARL